MVNHTDIVDIIQTMTIMINKIIITDNKLTCITDNHDILNKTSEEEEDTHLMITQDLIWVQEGAVQEVHHQWRLMEDVIECLQESQKTWEIDL